ncbi:MAG: hypothetical protein EU548_01825 [Promethearchaeota archaeon]|nr:MAG: hypothetical protein EU548_01825 [Candidatus Lokiarchaeota archaeon]
MLDFKIKELEDKYSKIEKQVYELKRKLENKELSEKEFTDMKNELSIKLNKFKEEIIKMKDKERSEIVDSDSMLLEELKELRKNFQVDLNNDIEKATRAKLYISANPYDHFRFVIDFHKYPKKPKVLFSPEVKEIIKASPEEVSNTLNLWDKENPGHLIDIFEEIENELINKIGLEIDAEPTEPQKLAARRKAIKLAKECEENNEFEDAIWFLKNAINIFKEFKEWNKVEKYNKKIEELQEKI